MNDRQAIFASVLASIIIAVCGVSLVFANAPVEASPQVQVRDDVVRYIRMNHPETAQFLTLNWTGGRVETPLLGAETYIYSCQGWKVTIKYQVAPKPTYTITADYTVPAGGVLIPYAVNWQGTFSDGAFTESDYSFTQ